MQWQPLLVIIGFAVNRNLNYWSLFGLIPLLAAMMATGIGTNDG
ncbi:hypothetical protein [Nostoc sp.]